MINPLLLIGYWCYDSACWYYKSDLLSGMQHLTLFGGLFVRMEEPGRGGWSLLPVVNINDW